MQEHGWSWTDIQNMIPFERDIYIMLLSQHIKEENDRLQQQQMQQKMRGRR